MNIVDGFTIHGMSIVIVDEKKFYEVAANQTAKRER